VEAAWRVVDPILDHPAPVAEYECGTWPAAAEAMIQGETGWHDTFTDNQE
jgi:glucose-6-phosphate 1-dehydrogenase